MSKQIQIPVTDLLANPQTVKEPTDVLTREQRARIECLRAAREVLVNRGFGSSGKADPTEVVSLAMFIETGQDPYGKPTLPFVPFRPKGERE